MGVEHRGSRKIGFLLGDYEEEVVVVVGGPPAPCYHSWWLSRGRWALAMACAC